MKAKQKHFSAAISIAVALSMLMISVSAVISAEEVSLMAVSKVPETKSVHENMNITEITGEVVEPPMLTSAASSVAREKEWYEYVFYSPNPVACYYLSDNIRLSFYDPYDYASALVMEVDDSITDWSSNNSMQISYTTGNSLTNSNGTSTDTSTSTQVAKGDDVSNTYTDESTVTTTVEGKVHTYNYSKSGKEHTETEDDTWSISEQLLGEVETTTEAGLQIAGVSVTAKGGVNVTNTNNFGLVKTDSWKDEEFSDGDEDFSDYSHGYTQDDSTSTQTSDAGYSQTTNIIADRVTKSTGYSSSTSISMSTDNSTTITKTYDAGYFNANGAPLQWKIIKYTVKMPMEYRVEYLVDGEWIFWDTQYCLLNTIQGTCRAWLQNNVAYYEHWGTGEPVTWDEFWSQFFTEDQLIAAYKNRLYPDF